jgi:hypothetical protein
MEVGSLVETELVEAELPHSILVGGRVDRFPDLSDAEVVCDAGHSSLD